MAFVADKITMCEKSIPHYVIVELYNVNWEKEKENKEVVGLFRGFIYNPDTEKELDKKFIYLLTSKTTSQAFHIDKYKIVSIRTFDGIMRELCIFMEDKEDQEAAIEILDNLLNKCKTDSNNIGTYIVKEHYKDVPEDFDKGSADRLKMAIEGVTSKPTTPAKVIVKGNEGNTYDRTPTVYNNTYVSANVKKPKVLKRSKDKPDITFLEEIKNKVISIHSNSITKVVIPLPQLGTGTLVDNEKNDTDLYNRRVGYNGYMV